MTVFIKEMTMTEIASEIKGKITPSASGKVCGITTDSRDAGKGMMFIALKGQRVDGHDFIPDAIKRGAECALSERLIEGYEDKIILVDNTLAALGLLAQKHKEKINPTTVAVTGSVGKTTTKEFIYSVLAEKYYTHKSEGNHNNEIGLPMSIMSLAPHHKAAVYELAMSQRGEISYLSNIVKPDIAVITNIGSMHIENLGSREAIRDAKMEICDGLKKGGKLILNGDEPLLAGIEGAYYVAFKNPNADLIISNIIEGEHGSAFDITIRGDKIESVVIPSLGEHNVFDAAVAYAVGILLGMSESEIRRGLMNFSNTGMRQNIYFVAGIKIIEDCYNAGPESMRAALNVLNNISERNGGRAVAVLGEMLELGEYAEAFHKEIGAAVVKSKVKHLYAIGKNAKYFVEGAVEKGMPIENISYFENPDDYEIIAKEIKKNLRPLDNILFKASRALMLERVIGEFKKLLE